MITNLLNFLQYHRKCPLFFLTPHEHGIGNTAEEIHYGLLYAKRTGKKAVILHRWSFLGNPAIPNKAVFRVESPHRLSGPGSILISWIATLFITIFLGFIPAAFDYIWSNSKNFFLWGSSLLARKKAPIPYKHFRYCFPILKIGTERLWNPEAKAIGDKPFSLDVSQKINWESEVEQPLSISINPEKELNCIAALRKLGLGPDDWFVCLHVREAGFYNDYSDIRNNTISNYFLAIQQITAAGGWVIRMGDSTMTRLPSMDRVIDYPFSKLKSDLMDVFLIKNCKFYFGQNSGILDIAYLFQKQCALVNVTEWSVGYPRNKNSLSIFKHLFSAEKERYLSVQELLDSKLICADFQPFDRRNHYKENTPEEICDLISEILGQDRSYRYTTLQEEFIRLRREHQKKWLLDPTPVFSDAKAERILRYRIATRLELKSTLGRKFLEQHWSKNGLNEAPQR